MSRAGADRSKRVDTSINRLISQIIPDNPHNTEDENQQRHDLLFQQVKEQLERQVHTIRGKEEAKRTGIWQERKKTEEGSRWS